eukprot:scaffold21.g2124.t1
MSLEFFESVAAAGQEARASHLVVQCTQERSSWVGLPPALAASLYRAGAALPAVLELRPLVQRGGLAMAGPLAVHVAWAGGGATPGCIAVSAGLARALGLREGASVAVAQAAGVPEAASVTVEPASEDDWEVVELNAEFLEQQLLTQVGVVGAAQPLPLWVRSHLVTLRVTALVPAAPAARLVQGTEIYVAPRLRVGASVAGAVVRDTMAPPSANGQNGGGSLQQNERPRLSETTLRVQELSDRALSGAEASSSQALGTAPPRLPAKLQRVLVAPATLVRTGFAAGDWVRLTGRASKSLAHFACLVSSELVAQGHLGLSPAQCMAVGAEPCSYVRLQQLSQSQRDLLQEADEHMATAHANGVHGSANGQLGSRGASSAEQQGEQQVAAAAPLQGAQTANGSEGNASDALLAAAWLRKPAEQALRHLLPVLGSAPRSLLQSWGVPKPGGLLVAGPPGSGKSALAALLAAALRRHPQCLTHTVVVSCRELAAEGAHHAQTHLIPKASIQGGRGPCCASPRSSRLPTSVREPSRRMLASCRARASVSLPRPPQAQIREAQDHMPALLVLDNLDVLCPAEALGADGGTTGGDPALVAWLCDVLDHLAAPSGEWGSVATAPGAGDSGAGGASGDGASCGSSEGSGQDGAPRSGGSLAADTPAAATRVQLWPPLVVAATCKDVAEVAASLRAAGRLDHTVSLPAPGADSRAAMLEAGLRSRGAAAVAQDVHAVAEQAEGFDAGDLGVLLDRALHLALRRQLTSPEEQQQRQLEQRQREQQQSASRGSEQRPVGSLQLAASRGGPALAVARADLAGALEGMTPAAFWGVGTRQALQRGVAGWEDVGGLAEVRAALHEALELPLRHAALVAGAPLRLRTGCLLYGPPGCGKTHAVAAAVAATRVRCISVSGPELLNKYIGASEAAVRDVFVRAAAAAPCVLFFDEFDALAPARGHDNTGVTDRVVNQLLTELDGVEGLRGVCVIGATSRPDLIDAALLRPGRLDRLLYCGLPTPLERGAILAALARGLRLAPDVDLPHLAYNAEEELSGADLSAVLAEAQLAAVHEVLEAEEEEGRCEGGEGGDTGSTHAASGSPAHAPAVVARRHLEAALAAARPSLAADERWRLEAIYARFRQSRKPGLEGGAAAADKGKGKMVSWA